MTPLRLPLRPDSLANTKKKVYVVLMILTVYE